MEYILGIIPAGAGLTSVTQPLGGFVWDHPRGCGAHGPPIFLFPTWRGSSPRVRGSQSRFRGFAMFLGIIPAGAGLTSAAFE